MPRRPSSPVRLRHRTPSGDLDALELIGRCGYITQPAVAFGSRRGRAKSVISEVVRRLERRGLLRIDRSHRMALNLLSLTAPGRDFLLDHRATLAELLFVPVKPLSPSVFRHTLAIADCMAVCQHLSPKPAMLLPAPAIQRLLPGDAIPDLLIGFRSSRGERFVATEVDCGTEGPAVLAEKFRRLPAMLTALSAGSPASVHVLTTDARRAERIRAYLRESPLPTLVQILPSSTGDPAALAALARLFGVTNPEPAPRTHVRG